MNKRVTIELSAELVELAERKAADQGRPAIDLIEDGVRMAIGQEKPFTKEKPRGPIPVSSATGGMRPGFEHMTYSEIQELDDLEYVERMRDGFR